MDGIMKKTAGRRLAVGVGVLKSLKTNPKTPRGAACSLSHPNTFFGAGG